MSRKNRDKRLSLAICFSKSQNLLERVTGRYTCVDSAVGIWNIWLGCNPGLRSGADWMREVTLASLGLGLVETPTFRTLTARTGERWRS